MTLGPYNLARQNLGNTRSASHNATLIPLDRKIQGVCWEPSLLASQTVSYPWGTDKAWSPCKYLGDLSSLYPSISWFPWCLAYRGQVGPQHTGALTLVIQEHGPWHIPHSQVHPCPKMVGKGLETGLWRPSGQNPFLDQGAPDKGKAELMPAAAHVQQHLFLTDLQLCCGFVEGSFCGPGVGPAPHKR